MRKHLKPLAATSLTMLACYSLAILPIVGPQIRIDVNNGTAATNENSAASLDPYGLEIVGTSNDWRASGGSEIIRMAVMVSNDGGQTWTDFHVRPPAANQSSVEGDPMTAYDNRTGTLWVGAISFAGNGGLYVARKNPGANTFQPSVQIRTEGGADKCWMAAGIAPGNPNATRVYVSYNLGTWRSADMGQTWQGPLSNPATGIGFLPRVGPNGELYMSWWDFSSGHWVVRSDNGGLSWNAPVRAATRMDTWGTQDGSRFPGNFRVPPMCTLAVNPINGKLYLVYFDTTNIVNGQRNVDLYMTTSTDRGQTWTTPRRINFDANPPGDQFFPWLEVDRKGQLHLGFWDSRNVVQNDNVTNGMFDNYYMYSGDDGNTWTEFRLTPNSWNSNNDGLNRSNQFLGDYNGLAVGGNWAYPVYTSTQNGNPDTFTNIAVDPALAPDKFTVTQGALSSGTLQSLVLSDDSRLVVEARRPNNPATASAEVEAIVRSFTATPSRIQLTVEVASTGAPARMRTEMFNYVTSTWETVDERDAVPGDTNIVVVITSNASRFVNPATKEMRVRSASHDRGVTFLAWEHRIDRIEWLVTP